MIVRTYGRRSRGGISTTLSDSLDDNDAFDPYIDSFSSQEATHDVYAFSSQGSTHFDTDPTYADGTVLRKAKRQKKGEAKGNSTDIQKLGLEDFPMLRATSTLMETQEFGEMMEHVDEVNFALDGLRKGQPFRIKRASLLSLLGICGTGQQRRLLRTHGMVKTIIDSVVGLSLDDSPSNLAAATLFYVFISDGQDELLLESSRCIRFLIELLNPVISRPAEDRNPGIGSKLLRLRKDAENLSGRDSKSDRNSTIIFSRVKEILCSCKELNSTCGDDSRMRRPELSPKWIALLAMEKATFSTIALEETSGIIRKTGGNFKEKLREFGGLDAVFEVATHCHSIMEEWRDVRSSSSSSNAKDDVHLETLLLLLKFLKIMENATFLSKDNQNYLLQMRGKRNYQRSCLSFTKLLISAIKILSGLFLDHRAFASGFKADLSAKMNNPADTNDGAFSIRSFKEQCSVRGSSSQRSDTFRDSHCLSSSSLNHSTSFTETKPSSTNGSYSMKANFSSASALRLSGETSKSCSTGGTSLIRNGLKNFGKNKKSDVTRGSTFEISEHVEDPFAFDEDGCEPSKWEVLSSNKVQARNKTSALAFGQAEPVGQLQQQTGLHNFDDIQQSLPESSTSHQTEEILDSQATDEEHRSLIADCLLSAVKVLMNLTNDNPVGCRQIAECGGLETMASVIACHYPAFGSSSSSSSSVCEIEEYGVKIEFEEVKPPNKQQISDQEMDLLVAILGLLVNMVEKDDNNRSRLATCSVSLGSTQGGSDCEGYRQVIPLLCSIFLAHITESETAGEDVQNVDAEEMILQGEKEAEKMIVEAYTALLLAFLSTESKSIRRSIAECLPSRNLSILIPVLEKFVAFHLALEMLTPETHKIVMEVIESLRIP